MNKKKSNYQVAKEKLKHAAKLIKKEYKGDLPAQRMYINDATDFLCKDGFFALSDHQKYLLHNYCCTLHPKKN